MNLTDEQRLAYARELAANPLLEENLAERREDILADWEGTEAADVERREKAWTDIQALNDLRAAIKETLTKLEE